jgi:photosystem II stability/assembly factor-like uncharacterized protein
MDRINEKFSLQQKAFVIWLIICAFMPLNGNEFSSRFLKHFDYREIGPTRQGGRVVSIAVSSQDSYVYFVGAGPGGLWKTINNGNTFESIFDNEGTSGIGHVTLDPSNHDFVWVGTGESNLRNSTQYGDGIYKSIDGGKSWSNMGLRNTQHIGKVIVHPQNSDIVYVAAQGQYYTDNDERGVYKTIDGGKSWKKILGVKHEKIHVGVTDLVMDPRDPNVIYAASYQRIRRPWGFSSAGPKSGIYKTTDGGGKWIKLSKGLPSGILGKIGLAIYPKDPDILYAIVEDANSPEMSFDERWIEIQNCRPSSKPTVGNIVYRSDDAGITWYQASKGNVGGRPNYYGQIIVDPNNDKIVYVLSEKVDISKDAGKTWSRAFEYGGDNHVLWINPTDSRHMILGYDYGFARSYDSGKNWIHFDNVSLAQLYAINFDMDFPYNVYGGMQDFGTWKGPSIKKGRFPIRFEDWEHVLGGDGFYMQVDPTDSRWLYCQAQFGELSRNDQKTGVRKPIQYSANQDLRFNWSTPFLLSSHNPKIIYHGANVLLKSSNMGDQWQEISPDLTKNDLSKNGGIESWSYGTITAIAESPLKKGVLWIGTDDGNVQITTDDGESWQLLNENIPNNPEYWVSRLIASHHQVGTAYLSFTGRHRTDFKPYLYKTTDYGETWIPIANNLPSEPINVIREDHKNPNLLFVGTDRTVYVTIDGGITWHEMKNDLPTIPIHDLAIHPRENDLIVGTHGRGFYIADISPLQEINQIVLEEDAYLFNIKPKVQWVMPSQKAVADQNFEGENEPHGPIIHYYLKNSIQGGVKLSIYDDQKFINKLNGPGQKGMNSVMWGLTKRGKKKTKEEIAKWDREVATGEIEPFYDYYDTNEYFVTPDEEVGITGLSLSTRVAWEPGMKGREYEYLRVKPGNYRIVIKIYDKEFERNALILEDIWFDQ